MADILLLEPNYNNKYPPLGLMKLSYYHKEVIGDYVRFAKGTLPESLKSKKWDRVYVTSLFTFEWQETKKAIQYALTKAKDPACVYVGGIAATLMIDKIKDEFKDYPLKYIPGLLNEPYKIGYADDYLIDTITPDYSLLDDIRDQYVYPTENAYFAYTTRGCGMKCGFCAVQTLEPTYIPYIPIKEQIENIIKKYGEKKDLLLMDNNVLKSPRFSQIVEDIKDLGFGIGATFKSPSSGKFVKRYVDFNQGLDGFLLTEEKAVKLAELAIKPARIAFDHIEDVETYKTAIKRCSKYGITELSNYILYNSDTFTGKGHSYQADSPEDLYDRLSLTIDLKDEINSQLEEGKKIAIFSFPMRYIPLEEYKRGYVGEKWNTKYLRAIQRMLIPTQGKGVSSRSFFEADFGADLNEFIETLAMPEDIIATRGRFEKRENETAEQCKQRKDKWDENKTVLNEWLKLFRQIVANGQKDEFINIISDNTFKSEKFFKIKNETMQKLYLFYLSDNQFLLLLNDLNNDRSINTIINYCLNEFPTYYERIVRYIYSGNIVYSKLAGFIKIFGAEGLKSILQYWINDNYLKENILYAIEKAQVKSKHYLINFTLLKTYKSYLDFNCLNQKEKEQARKYILTFNDAGILELLRKKSKNYKKALFESVKDNFGKQDLIKQIDILTDALFRELSIY